MQGWCAADFTALESSITRSINLSGNTNILYFKHRIDEVKIIVLTVQSTR